MHSSRLFRYLLSFAPLSVSHTSAPHLRSSQRYVHTCRTCMSFFFLFRIIVHLKICCYFGIISTVHLGEVRCSRRMRLLKEIFSLFWDTISENLECDAPPPPGCSISYKWITFLVLHSKIPDFLLISLVMSLYTIGFCVVIKEDILIVKPILHVLLVAN